MGAPKGHPKWGGRTEGTPNRETLLKEERRAIFDSIVSAKWEETIRALPPTYIADQFMGKAEDKVKITEEVGNLEEIQKLSDKFDEFLKNNA